MTYKVNLEALKNKLKENEERAKSRAGAGRFKKKSPEESVELKVAEGGEYGFRALPYFHNEDISVDPFTERSYHQGIPGNPRLYCPKENDGQKCDICEFTWERMKEVKGQRDAAGKPMVEQWKKYLPKKKVVIPGILRGPRSKEGIKFFLLGTYSDNLSEAHTKLVKWMTSAKTCNFLSPTDGFDFEISYETYSEAKSAALGGAKCGFKDIELSRDESPLGENGEDPEALWEKYKKEMPKIESLETFEKKTSADMTDALEKWMKAEEKKAEHLRKKAAESSGSTGGSKSQAQDVAAEENSSEETVSAEDMPVETSEVKTTEAALDRKAKLQARLKAKL